MFSFLEPLVPVPIVINGGVFSGKLMIDGNLDTNAVLFRFKFDDPVKVVPVLVRIQVLEKTYEFFCDCRDPYNFLVKTAVLNPEFSLRNKIKIIGVEPLVTYMQGK
jgi:hypothetical protein